MIEAVPQADPASRRTGRTCLPPLAALAAAAALAGLGGMLSRHPAAPIAGPAPQAMLAEPASGTDPEALPAPAADLSLDPWPGALGGPLSRWAWTDGAASGDPAAPPAPSVAEVPATEVPEAAPAEPLRGPMTVPLPVPRPPELRRSADLPRRTVRPPRQQEATAPPPVEDGRSFLEKLFGAEPSPARSYVALETRPADLAPRPAISPPLAAPPGLDGPAAIYDITARTVTLPSGERLEAHSGLGEIMDDPRHVHVRMRGATPPGTYVLTEREQLFHGVRAIRLTPVGGPETIHGRVGLLAHTFMLGPSGASNGCVSFRDYDRFLQAYLRGEVQRLVVVAGRGDTLPGVAQAGAVPIRMARN